MNRPCLIFWLRIAVSAACVGVSCSFIGLCVRSYWWYDQLWHQRGTARSSVQSVAGDVYLYHHAFFSPPPGGEWGHRTEESLLYDTHPSERHQGFVWQVRRDRERILISIPYWFLIAISAAFAFVPWLPWHKLQRFSLRTLLIVTTLVAVVLGLGAYLLR